MRKIVKSQEPQEWTQYRRTPDASFKSIPELVTSLYREQGYICAYCMRRLPCKDSFSTEDHRIEHIQSRTNYPDRQLDYTNLVVCCPGNIGGDTQYHCDKLKGDKDLSFTPVDDNFIETLSYSSKDGRIKSSVPQYDSEINDILNLNQVLLKRNRYATWKGVMNILNKKGWKTAQLSRFLKEWDEKDKDGKYKEYCGIVVYFLRRKLKQSSK